MQARNLICECPSGPQVCKVLASVARAPDNHICVTFHAEFRSGSDYCLATICLDGSEKTSQEESK